MSKYHSKKCVVNGEVFDSKKESKRFQELRLLEKAGEISNLRRQVKYILIPTQRIDGKLVERECSYKADFVYEQDGQTIVEDVKGFRTETYKLKRKMMYYFHHVIIKEI